MGGGQQSVRRVIRRSGTIGRGSAPDASLALETLEGRVLLSAAFDLIGLTRLRGDNAYSSVDGSGVGVAVLDTGVLGSHPDLRNNVVAWYDAVTRTESAVTSAFDPEGHGTHVAGTAASSNPAIGVAPRARIIAVRALPSDNEATPRHDTVVDGLNWVLENHQRYNIRVVNMSLGIEANYNSVPGNGSSNWERAIDALERVGVTVVSASGNSYANYAAPGASAPAVFSTLSVGSVWEDGGQGDTFPLVLGSGPYASVERSGAPDRVSAFSQRSTLPNQVFAPGQTIYSTFNGVGGRQYATLQGTSMASPIVAGVVALLQDAARTFGGRYLSTSEVTTIVRTTADTIVDAQTDQTQRLDTRTRQVTDLQETGLSFLRVNAFNAVARVRSLFAAGSGGVPTSGDVDGRSAGAVRAGLVDGVVGLNLQGVVGTDGSNSVGAADVDLVAFEAASRGVVTVRAAQVAGGQNAALLLRLFDASGNVVASAPGTAGAYPTITTGVLEPGQYFVGVTSTGNNQYNPVTGAGTRAGSGQGDYALSIALANPDPNGVVGGAVSVAELPAEFNGWIGADLGVPVGSQDVDFFQVTAPDSGTLTIDINTSQYGIDAVDSYIRVLDENFQTIAFNDDRTPGDLDALVQVALTRGQVVYVAISDYSNAAFNPLNPYDRSAAGAGGFYDLSMSFDNLDSDGTLISAVPLMVGQTVAGSVGTDPGRGTVGLDGTKDVDFYAVELAENGIIEVNVTSADPTFTPSVVIWGVDETGDQAVRLLSADGSNGRVLIRAEAFTTYFVSVTGVGNAGFNWAAPGTGTGGQTGNYQLTFQQRTAGDVRDLTDDSVNTGTPRSIVVGQSVSAVLGSDDGFLLGADDVDMYRLVPESSGRLQIRTALVESLESADTVLRVFDAQGNEIAFNDDVAANQLNSAVTIQAVAGQTYYIGVSGFGQAMRSYNPITGAGRGAGDTGQYALSVTQDTGPRLVVTGGGFEIRNNDRQPTAADLTAFGTVALDGQQRVRTFVLTNSGSSTLQFAPSQAQRVRIDGVAAADYALLTAVPRTLAPGASLRINVRFDPSVVGTRNATIVVRSNDVVNQTYTFGIRGTAVLPARLSISGGPQSKPVSNNDTTPIAGDGTGFGLARAGRSVVRTFTITNTGIAPLRLTGPDFVRLSVESDDEFVVVQQPRGVLAVGASTTFRVRFSPTDAGIRSATVELVSNDPFAPVYRFALRGNGQVVG